MKRKLDFITNSSTMSFIVWGIQSDDPFEDYGQQIYEQYKNYLEKNNYGVNFTNIDELREVNDESEIANEVTHFSEMLSASYDMDNYELTIGACPTLMKDEETLLDFKTRICEELEKIGIKKSPSDIKFHERCWENR